MLFRSVSQSRYPFDNFTYFFTLTTQVGNICRIKSVILDKRKQCIRITLVPSRGVVPILDATITSENPISKPDEGGDVVSGTSEGYSDG